MIRFVALVASAVALTAPVAHAAFPGQNGRIAFNSDREGDFEIYTVAPDGTDLRRLTTATGSDFEPAWSADGQRLAFTSTRHGNREIYAIDGDGSNELRLTASPGEDIEPSWSPDGRRIVFSSNREGNFDLYSMDPDGSDQTRLTSSPLQESDPDWSPDGSRIAFSSVDLTGGSVMTMTPTGADVRQLTTDAVSGLDWSPDGSRIVYALGALVSVRAVDGGDRQFLTGPIDDLRFEGGPAWAPAGDLIVYDTQVCDHRHGCGPASLEVVRPDGTGRTGLLPGGASADWQPLVEPRREDFKNASKYCKALREFLGDEEFAARHGTHGGCVSARR